MSGSIAGFRETVYANVPEGFDAIAIARRLKERSRPQPRTDTAAGSGAAKPKAAAATVLHIVRDDRRLDALERALTFFSPDTRTVSLPAWDTVPYDRVGPNTELVAARMTSLARLALGVGKQPLVVLSTVNAVLQRLPPRNFIRKALRQLAAGQRVDMGRLAARLTLGGYVRTGTVMDAGEFAVRGGILDLFPPGRANPVRLDFFGDTLESIKSFDPQTQRTLKVVRKLILMPVSEVPFSEEAAKHFRQRYVELFGGSKGEDPLYEAVSAGQRYPGMEHWLPLFHEGVETIFDYVGDAAVSFDHLADDAVRERFEQIEEHYKARVESLETANFGAPPYKPVPPGEMFVDGVEWGKRLGERDVVRVTPFMEAASGASPESLSVDRAEPDDGRVRDFGVTVGRNFAPERQAGGGDLFGEVVGHIKARLSTQRRVVIASWTPGGRERMATLLGDRGLKDIRLVDTFPDVLALPEGITALVILGLERGFDTNELSLIGEQDILGDRLVRPRRRVKKAVDVITQATALSVGDLVVHAEHGIGRFAGLKTIDALGAEHDCLELVYAGGDKLFQPVENIELLSRYGGDGEVHQLDRLGGAAWQSRKARLKQRLREIAGELIKVAALRELRAAPVLIPPEGVYDEFVARFPFEETDDQLSSIEDVQDDLAAGKPMDRLVCGDVGFGKTEVALRAAFITAMAGLQVAVVVPTTLLARQHFRTFQERFEGYPVKVAQASRLVSPKDLSAVKTGISDGTIDIVVGTHALLSKSINFARLGLLVIDEEQHFGVTHKERLKSLREDVHVLTLSATPIPRTLQLALSGVRELSLITTPPVDRLAVRSYIAPFDPVILREALRRERYRGGQTFYVAPRISDLGDIAAFLAEAVPELRVARAHGQLSPSEIERIMTAFYEGKFDILLSTSIVESGLDVPNANTMIVHRADMFGLAALYQLRGRVGRSKTRAYAYFTTAPGRKLSEGAEKRLKVLQSLDTLGAGFSLASHDLDIRGGGNLLGEEQTGHIKEVGFELYQSMLEEAIEALKGGDMGEVAEQWSPQISLGTPTLIPEDYISDLQLRLGLYRRLSGLETRADIDDFQDELVDRFGPPPPEVLGLLDVMEIKGLCRSAGVAQVDAGPRGAVISFRDNKFANPEGLVRMMQRSYGQVKLQPDHRLVFKAEWEDPKARLAGTRETMAELAKLAARGPGANQEAN